MFDKFDYFNRGYIFGVKTDKYKPYINYDWSTTTTSGLRYLKDVGSTPTYNASMYFGRGAYLNGVDQTITVPINTTIQTSLKRVNGVVTINETSQALTNYVISGLGVHKDYYLFTRLLTTAEKDSYTNTPELFYAMAQADSTCVLNMPLHGVDKYQVDYSRYSLGLVNADVTLSNSIPLAPNTITKVGNVFTIVDTVAEEFIYEPNIKFYPLIYDTSLYTIKIKIKCISGTAYVKSFEGTPQIILNKLLTVGQEYTYESATRFTAVNGQRGILIFDGVNYTNFTVEVTVEVYKVVAGINEVINYTTSVRDNAKNLQYGLQTCKFVRDSLGVIQSASDYLECDGTGYATIPSHTDTVNIKMTVNPTSLSGNLLSGGVTKTLTGLTLNVDNNVVISNVTPTGAITLASGFSGTIKTYTEELV